MSETTKSLCQKCVMSVWCPTWAEVKCLTYERRIYNHTELTECPGFKKRPKNFTERKCRCEDCLKNELLFEENEEE